MNITLNTKITELSGIGSRRAELFSKIGISDVRGLLYHFPRGYQHRGDVRQLRSVQNGTICAFVLTVATPPVSTMLKGRLTLTKLTAFDESGKCTITFFNQNYLKGVFSVGDVFRFWGKISVTGSKYELTSPSYEPYSEDRPLPEFKALYPLTTGLTQNIISHIIKTVIEKMPRFEYLNIFDDDKLEENKLPCRADALRLLHFPETYDNVALAKSYIIYEELFLFAVAVKLSRSKPITGKAAELKISDQVFNKFISVIPYKLTGAQTRVISEIRSDMEKTLPMNRLMAGDVGSGKTICAAAAVYIAVMCGYQAALMAPTEILARQHYLGLSEMFEKFNIKTALLCGSSGAAEKKNIYSGLSGGTIRFLIGTHALISAGVTFCNLGLVITDEQHRFGVAQREALGEKGKDVHTLLMSATPIPRSLALVIYGDMGLSVIDEMPPGRQIIDTFIVNSSYRERLDGFIKKQCESGNQVYVVCPAIESAEESEEDDKEEKDSENAEEGGHILKFDQKTGSGSFIFDEEEIGGEASLPLKNAHDEAIRLNEKFSSWGVGYIHGRMKGAEKERVMNEFSNNNIKILVSTTVIEVGVNVPNATLMIIENAERYGLSQLHQIRGRVGRGKVKSNCILVTDSKSEKSLERLAVMRETNNGYKIAERDLELRGPGDFLPALSGDIRQHGSLEFKMASMCSDMDMLRDAFDEAAAVIDEDPQLNLPKNRGIRQMIKTI